MAAVVASLSPNVYPVQVFFTDEPIEVLGAEPAHIASEKLHHLTTSAVAQIPVRNKAIKMSIDVNCEKRSEALH